MCGRFSLGIDQDEFENDVRVRLRHLYGDNDDGGGSGPSAGGDGQSHQRRPAGSSSSASRPRWIGRNEFWPSYNVAPQTQCPIIRRAEPSDFADSPLSKASASAPPIPFVIQTMKWGLLPHTLKRPPGYGEALRTINARDDTILSGSSVWGPLLAKNRCVVVCQGFYEWFNKEKVGGKGKQAHFVGMSTDDVAARGKEPGRGGPPLMCMAGLWDKVVFEGTSVPVYSFTVITTSTNKQLNFLHDRMPVILSSVEEIKKWLGVGESPKDDSALTWGKEVASLMRPFPGELRCYPVPPEVGKVGRSSPDFIRPLSERKGGIQGFFKKASETSPRKGVPEPKAGAQVKKEPTWAETWDAETKLEPTQRVKEEELAGAAGQDLSSNPDEGLQASSTLCSQQSASSSTIRDDGQIKEETSSSIASVTESSDLEALEGFEEMAKSEDRSPSQGATKRLFFEDSDDNDGFSPRKTRKAQPSRINPPTSAKRGKFSSSASGPLPSPSPSGRSNPKVSGSQSSSHTTPPKKAGGFKAGHFTELDRKRKGSQRKITSFFTKGQ